MVTPTTRMQRWYSLLGSMGKVVSVHLSQLSYSSMTSATEHLIAASRAQLKKIRKNTPNRQIVLIGFNAGAAVAIQVALVEKVNSVICMGFAYNTFNGVRGTRDDRILTLQTSVLFVIGQHSARSR